MWFSTSGQTVVTHTPHPHPHRAHLDWLSLNKPKIITTADQREGIYHNKPIRIQYKNKLLIVRKTEVSKSRLVSVLSLISWESRASFLDQLWSEVKQIKATSDYFEAQWKMNRSKFIGLSGTVNMLSKVIHMNAERNFRSSCPFFFSPKRHQKNWICQNGEISE